MDIHVAAQGLLGAPLREATRIGARPHGALLQHRRGSLELRGANQVLQPRHLHRWAGAAETTRRAATLIVKAGKARTLTDDAALSVGDMCEWTKATGAAGGSQLGLVEAADSKKIVILVPSSSAEQKGQQAPLRKATITARQVVFRIPGGPFNEAALRTFSQVASQQAKGPTAAEPADALPADSNSASLQLESAWELAVADNIKTITLAELAGLVLDDDETPLSMYGLYRQLASDRLFFRQVAGKGASVPSLQQVAFEPRSPAAVDTLKQQIAAEQAAREDEAAWSAAVRAALAARRRADQPSPDTWQAGRHARRISALKALATQDVGPLSPDTLKLAQTSLALAGIVPPSASAQAPTTGSAASASPLAEAAANLLVDVRAWRRHEPVSALRKGVRLSFPDAVEREAQHVLQTPPQDTCAAIRQDLTHMRCYTIDDQGTVEVDDGLSIETLPHADEGSAAAGAVRVWVHVADPTRWLVPGSQLLEEAKLRSRTLYFPWGSVPMFPTSLSAPFSLGPQQESCALSVGLTLHADGSIQQVTVTPSRVVATHPLTYEQADALLSSSSSSRSINATPADSSSPASAADAAAVQDLHVLRQLADVRRAYREAKGCIEIPLPEVKVSVAESQLDAGRPNVHLKRVSQWDSPSRGLVAEMMILAGEAIGRLGASESLALPFRMQPPPHLPPASELQTLPEGPCRGYQLRRCMTRSGVSAVPLPHASLGLDAYVQVTSPIRRWSDLLAHMNLKAWLLNAHAPYTTADVEAVNQAVSSDRVREAGAAERMEDMYWITEHFRQLQSNKSAPHQWLGTVLGWQRQELKLAAVLLQEYGLEVVVKVDVDVSPGDEVQLALVEARPVAGMLRFFVSEYVSVNNQHVMEEDNAEEADAATLAMDSVEAAFLYLEQQEAQQQLQVHVSAEEEGDVSGEITSSAVTEVTSPLSSSAHSDATFGAPEAEDAAGGGGREAQGGKKELALC